MVENNGKELDRSTKHNKVNINNIKNYIYRMELEDAWIEAKESARVRLILRNAEDAIIEWHKEHWGGKREEAIRYDVWKGKLVECFARRVSPEDFLRSRQGSHEEPEDFLKRIKKDGKSLSLCEDIILGVFKNGLQRNRDYIRLALVGQTRITENVMEAIHEANKIAQERFQRSRKQKAKLEALNAGTRRTGVNSKTQVNAIPQDDLLNKDNYIYINGCKISCLLDTGAQDNYITRSVINKIKARTKRLSKPIERFTCLNEKFMIDEQTIVTFRHKETYYTLEFNVLHEERTIS